jgi:hypothetical protein
MRLNKRLLVEPVTFIIMSPLALSCASPTMPAGDTRQDKVYILRLEAKGSSPKRRIKIGWFGKRPDQDIVTGGGYEKVYEMETRPKVRLVVLNLAADRKTTVRCRISVNGRERDSKTDYNGVMCQTGLGK